MPKDSRWQQRGNRRGVLGLMSLPIRQAPASKAQTNCAAFTNNPLVRWSGNSPTGRRTRDLFRGYMAALGDPSDRPTVALVVAAAEAVVLAEVAREDCLRGLTDLKANTLVRIEGAANRALRRLKLDKAAPPPRAKSWRERMAEKQAATEARTEADAARVDETASLSDQRADEPGSQAGATAI